MAIFKPKGSSRDIEKNNVTAVLAARDWRGFPGSSRMSSKAMDEYYTVASQ
jgi:hypothetical protein